MDEMLVSTIIERISLVGTGLVDIIHLIDIHRNDGHELNIDQIHDQATAALKNMKEIQKAFAALTNPDAAY